MKTAIKAHGPEFKERLGLKRLKDVNDWFDLADYDRDGMVSVQWLPRDLTKPCHRPLSCVVAALRRAHSTRCSKSRRISSTRQRTSGEC